MAAEILSKPQHSKTTPVVINGTEVDVTERELTFERIVELADLGATGDVEYSVKYSRGPHDNQTGILRPGQSVKVKKGMRFVVKATVRS
ncbi:multiubiquitin [Promicromonospora sp. AC04]|uniref:multiubiquitin domain-containing protein n=1 Tax=Promicromonospora sp. AC04 TaxID=2135723 RepID=UPI000D364DBD|nr:multiubiquitin domain-containing protein [Promicromonospora sp. AC04]PUB27686.1 multiubiquitin [Promicromonospora sp. AC04]